MDTLFAGVELPAPFAKGRLRSGNKSSPSRLLETSPKASHLLFGSSRGFGVDKILNAPVILNALLILAWVVLVVRILFYRPAPESLLHASLLSHELALYFQALRDSNDDYAFIIVPVVGTEDFFQFKYSGHGLFTYAVAS